MNTDLAAVDVVQHEVEFVGRLERKVETNEGGVTDVANQNVPLSHDVLHLVLLQDLSLVDDLDRVE